MAGYELSTVLDFHIIMHSSLLAFVPGPQVSRGVATPGSSTSGSVSIHGNGCPCGSCSQARHGAVCKCASCSRGAHSVRLYHASIASFNKIAQL